MGRMLTQKELKRLLHYNPSTGVFTWLLSPARQIKDGDVAGCVSTYQGNKKYRLIRVSGELHLAHRLVFLYMKGAFPTGEVDHINGSGLDNRWVNLRQVSSRENSKNTRLRSDNTSGFVGVSWSKSTRKWRASIDVNGKRKHIGYFIGKQDAIKARMSASAEHGFHPNHGATQQP